MNISALPKVELHVHQDEDGMVVVRGRLEPEVGELLPGDLNHGHGDVAAGDLRHGDAAHRSQDVRLVRLQRLGVRVDRSPGDGHDGDAARLAGREIACRVAAPDPRGRRERLWGGCGADEQGEPAGSGKRGPFHQILGVTSIRSRTDPVTGVGCSTESDWSRSKEISGVEASPGPRSRSKEATLGLVTGIGAEPHLRWRSFCEEVIELAQRLRALTPDERAVLRNAAPILEALAQKD